MKKVILEVFNFIKNPNDERIENWSWRKNANYLFYILVFELSINFLVFFPILYILNIVDPIISETRIDYKENSLIYILIITAFLVPIVEELIFRLPLRHNKVFSILISKKKWNTIFRYLIYISILAFGFVHSSNYQNDSFLFYCMLPMIIATQLVGGIFLTFLRVRFNLLSSIIAHIVWNSLLTVIPVLISFLEKPYAKENDNYSLRIKYINYNNKNSQKFEIDSSSNKIFKVEINEYSINHILDSLFQHKRNKEDHLINIHLKSEKGISKKNLKKVLLDYDKEEL